LLVATGQTQTSYVMPFLVGLPLTEADRLLTSAGLKLAKTTFTPSPLATKGAVTEQIPVAGSKVTSDSDIEVTVAQ
jgi:beta-lactam-binding protein with PASTA domain